MRKKYPVLLIEIKDPKTKKVLDSYYESEKPIEYDTTPILSGKEAYIAMLHFVDDYFKGNYQEKVGEVLTRMQFDGYGDTVYEEFWELWERIVKGILKEKIKKQRKLKRNKLDSCKKV